MRIARRHFACINHSDEQKLAEWINLHYFDFVVFHYHSLETLRSQNGNTMEDVDDKFIYDLVRIWRMAVRVYRLLR